MADKGTKKGFIGFLERILAKVVKTFLDIRSELKKVIWPDRRKLVQSTLTVIAIIMVFGVVIWVVDSILAVFLESIGFFSPSAVVTATPIPTVTAAVSPTVALTPTVTPVA